MLIRHANQSGATTAVKKTVRFAGGEVRRDISYFDPKTKEEVYPTQDEKKRWNATTQKWNFAIGWTPDQDPADGTRGQRRKYDEGPPSPMFWPDCDCEECAPEQMQLSEAASDTVEKPDTEPAQSQVSAPASHALEKSDASVQPQTSASVSHKAEKSVANSASTSQDDAEKPDIKPAKSKASAPVSQGIKKPIKSVHYKAANGYLYLLHLAKSQEDANRALYNNTGQPLFYYNAAEESMQPAYVGLPAGTDLYATGNTKSGYQKRGQKPS